MSSSDWTRIQRLKQARSYATDIAANSDILNKVTAGNPFSPLTKISRVAGSSRTRREASKWIDYKASQDTDFSLKTTNYQYTSAGTFVGTRNTLYALNCNCGTITGMNGTVQSIKKAGCLKCNSAQHLRM